MKSQFSFNFGIVILKFQYWDETDDDKILLWQLHELYIF